MKHPILPLLLFLTLHPHSTVVSTTTDDEQSPPNTIQCSTIPHGPPQPIPLSHLNDNYCDCPYDNGIDEVHTGACAGSMDWIGLTPPSSSSTDETGGGEEKGWFPCTQQPDLRLPPSRINDGICDCCDGSDESSSSSSGVVCPDQCTEILEQQRYIQQQIQTKYTIGKQQYNRMKLRYDMFVQETQEEIRMIQDVELVEKQRALEEVKEWLLDVRRKIARVRLDVVERLMVERFGEKEKEGDWLGDLSLLLEEFGDEEEEETKKKERLYRELITRACRFAGELTRYEDTNVRYGTTCGPLRLAGLDLGFYWDGSDDDDTNNGETAVVRSVVGWNEKTKKTTEGTKEEEEKEEGEGNDDVMAEIGRMWLENDKVRGQIVPLVLGTDGAGAGNGATGKEPKPTNDEPKEDTEQKKQTRHRRSSEPIDDDDEDEYFDEDWYSKNEPYEDDDFVDYDDEDKDEEDNNDNTVVTEKDDGEVPPEEGAEDPVMDSIEERKGDETTEEENDGIDPFRYHFYVRAKALIERIDAFTNAGSESTNGDYDDDDDVNDEDIEEDQYRNDHNEALSDDNAATESDGTIPTHAPTPPPSIDPMKLSLLRTDLFRRVVSLEHGAVLASSASTLLTILDRYYHQHHSTGTKEDDWILLLGQLTALTIYHAQMGSADVVEAVRLAMIDPPSKDSCVSLHNVLCPGVEAKWPTGGLKVASEARCRERTEEGIHLCELEEEGEEVGIENDTLPSQIDDGYYNYYELEERDEGDPISQMFRVLDDFSFDEDDKDSAMEDDNRDAISLEISELEKKLSDLKETLRDATDSTNPKYGPSGILYSLRDECFSYVAGKYTYEVCLFSRASQKDSGANTNLGAWTGMERRSNDDGRGGYVMKWKHGTKCWNGPARTATVYVTCGGTEEDGETRLVAADEPNVCEYELRMESPIACDEAYALKHGLEP